MRRPPKGKIDRVEVITSVQRRPLVGGEGADRARDVCAEDVSVAHSTSAPHCTEPVRHNREFNLPLIRPASVVEKGHDTSEVLATAAANAHIHNVVARL
jgi:hypothetical protein